MEKRPCNGELFLIIFSCNALWVGVCTEFTKSKTAISNVLERWWRCVVGFGLDVSTLELCRARFSNPNTGGRLVGGSYQNKMQ
jgi:hypothetical protein